jgi:hypothetical protein
VERAASRRLWGAALLGVFAAAVLARLACLHTEPWLDEIWSIGLSRKAATAADVFLKLRDDNNNPLITLYLHFFPPGLSWTAPRLLSLAAGLLTVVLLGWDPEDRPRGVLAGLLAAASTHMVLYATEARGYALMGLLSLSCFLLLRPRDAPTRPREAAFALCALLAFLSHPTFVYVFAALFVWAWRKLPARKRLSGLAVLFGPPALGYGIFEALQFPLTIDGAGRNDFWGVALRTLDLWSGAPDTGLAAVAGAAALLGLLVWELRNVRRERPDEFVFFAALFAGAFAFAAIFPFPFERHFYACLPFALLLAAGGLARLIRLGGAKRGAAVLLALLFILGNGARDRALSSPGPGRGHYREAVERMAADTPGHVITVASDHDVRNRMVLDYYADFVMPRKRIEYVPADRITANPPDWFLMHGFFTDPRRAPIGVTLHGSTAPYRLVEVYPYSGLSGWTWMLYRRDQR